MEDGSPWQLTRQTELSKRRSDSAKHFTEHFELDELAHHDNITFLFHIESSMWACPWSIRAPTAGVNTLGLMTDES